MTCREWMAYILLEGLEDEPLFKDGKLAGFMTVEEYAVQNRVGIATVNVWVKFGKLKHIKIGDTIYIPKMPLSGHLRKE